MVGTFVFLSNQTRVLVTHNVTFLPRTDTIIVLSEDGKVEDQGTYDELLDRGGAFSDFLQNYVMSEETEADSDEDEVGKHHHLDFKL